MVNKLDIVNIYGILLPVCYQNWPYFEPQNKLHISKDSNHIDYVT